LDDSHKEDTGMKDEFVAFLTACKQGDADTVRAMLAKDPALAARRDASGEPPIVAALYSGQTAIVDLLVDAGAPLDLFTAAALGRVDAIQASLDADPGGVHGRSFDGWTALHLAAFFGHPPAAALLLERGADVNARATNSIGNTPLHAAVAGGRVESALALIEAGADVNAADGGGHTPLHIAAEGGYLPIVVALLRRKADPHAVDAEDRTPLARAAARNHAAVIDLITLNE
jgi:ankyrin repeat protein